MVIELPCVVSKTLQEKRDLLAKYEEELREIRSRLAKVKDAEVIILYILCVCV